MDTLDKIIEQLAIQGKRQKDITDYLGIKETAFAEWKKGKSLSYKSKHIGKIAEYLNVTPDYLLGKSDSPEVDTDATKKNNIDICGKLSAVDKAKLLVYADNLSRNIGNDGNGSKDGDI